MATEIGAPIVRAASEVFKTAPFRLGQKSVFLPSFRITLIHTPRQSPYYATFLVPLNMNKLDLRDYLYNAYSLPVHSITSRIMSEPVSRDGPAKRERPLQNVLSRPPPKKKMTVRMDKPFVWPAPPDQERLNEEWGMETFKAVRAEQREFGRKMRRADTYTDQEEVEEMGKQAKRLLSGKEKWRPPRGKGDGSWAVRVEE